MSKLRYEPIRGLDSLYGVCVCVYVCEYIYYFVFTLFVLQFSSEGDSTEPPSSKVALPLSSSINKLFLLNSKEQIGLFGLPPSRVFHTWMAGKTNGTLSLNHSTSIALLTCACYLNLK